MASPIKATALLPSLQADLNNLRKLNNRDIQSTWHWQNQDIPAAEIFTDNNEAGKQWPIAPLNERHHIAWEKGLQVRWLVQTIVVPTDFYGYPLTGLTLRLSLTWWAEEAQVYVDGSLVQSGDLFECFTRICLSNCVEPQNTFQVAIRLVSPQHDNGALVRSHLTYELLNQPTPEPSFIADELTTLATLEPTHQKDIQSALSQLDWSSLTAPPSSPNADDLWKRLSVSSSLPPATIHPFQQSLSQLRRSLLPFSNKVKQRTIHCVGHAHLDMAWLWPIADTWDAAERTFRSVLSLQKDFPELTYTHSSPALFEWIEQHRPKLFQQIQKKVKEGSWSIDAGLWIEPELNIVGGEAIARHILYGQRYCQQKFGAISTVAWLPDTFGFCNQLPQILTQGSIETFATLKLSWNDTTQFPHQLFWWQSPDGTRIRSIMLPPIGTDIDPINMSTYAAQWEAHTQTYESLWLPGLGDHGGGPTRDMLEKSQRWEKSPFFPNLSFTTPSKYIAHLPQAELPVWKDELYLELHRGCYTTHADQKKHNRSCEDLLYQAEVFASVAQLVAQQTYPKEKIETAWKALLFNQFHDILPGTSIPEVFVEAEEGWKQVRQIGRSILEESLSAIASQIKLPPSPHPRAIPILVFNSLSWPRNSVVSLDSNIISAEPHLDWAIYDSKQTPIAHQNISVVAETETPSKTLFLASDIPAIGYKCYWLVPKSIPTDTPAHQTSYTLDNPFLTVSISSTTGEINSLVEKKTNKEVLSAPGNQLQLFQDKSGYWDAWDIATDYQQHRLPSPKLISIQWLEFGPIRQCIRTLYKTEKSTICQDYILDISTPYLIIRHTIQWNETHVLLKTNFPFSFSSPVATYETPFGSIARNTQHTTKAEKAKWEVPALRWADLTQTTNAESFGVSILTHAKHGFDAGPSHLRLTLLKSPTWPDANADKGHNQFTYAIYPHLGTWQSAHTVKKAYEFNIAPITYLPKEMNAMSSLPPAYSFLQIRNPNVVLSALKQSEDNPQAIILRCYEAHGQPTQLDIASNLSISTNNAKPVNILEQRSNAADSLSIEPYKITTYCLCQVS